MPRIRALPEDFVVEEVPLRPPTGEGPHAWLRVEKRLATTDEIARALARTLGLPRREVGYAGRKDRRAVARQWLSVPLADRARLEALELPGARVLRIERDREKLRLGDLAGNRFRLRVRELAPGEAERATARVEGLAERGMPNRFGRQRFGRDGKNVELGREILAAGRARGDRRYAFLMVSALQAAVFNRVLELRPFDALLPGDLALVHASGDLVAVADPAIEAARLDHFELSPTGPLFGTKTRRPRGEAARVEDQAMRDLGLDPGPFDPPRGLRVFGDRRPLRVRPASAAARELDGDLELVFELPPGSYATVLLEELFPEGFEEGPAR